MQDSNQVLGLLHGWYGLGAVLSPLIATSLVTEARVGWWYFYYVLVCALLFFPFYVYQYW
jgi:fucose permease